jgi:hypothetical protein
MEYQYSEGQGSREREIRFEAHLHLVYSGFAEGLVFRWAHRYRLVASQEWLVIRFSPKFDWVPGLCPGRSTKLAASCVDLYASPLPYSR